MVAINKIKVFFIYGGFKTSFLWVQGVLNYEFKGLRLTKMRLII